MSWRENWPSWQPPPDADDPDRDGGMSQLGAYEAGLTDDPGCWVQPVEVYWSPRLDPGARNTTRSSPPGSSGRSVAQTRDGPELEPGG
jgi:hypothetical protein